MPAVAPALLLAPDADLLCLGFAGSVAGGSARNLLAAGGKVARLAGGGQGTGARKQEPEDERMMSDVTEEEALELLSSTQERSSFFVGFEVEELQRLAGTLTVLQFKVGEVIVTQGEPASFFGLMLEGALAPQVDEQLLMHAQRGVGEIIGEMSLFTGGIRQASMVATREGSLAVVKFSQLERLKEVNEKLARKLNWQLARAAHSKVLEREGRSFADLPEHEIVIACSELLLKQVTTSPAQPPPPAPPASATASSLPISTLPDPTTSSDRGALPSRRRSR